MSRLHPSRLLRLAVLLGLVFVFQGCGDDSVGPSDDDVVSEDVIDFYRGKWDGTHSGTWFGQPVVEREFWINFETCLSGSYLQIVGYLHWGVPSDDFGLAQEFSGCGPAVMGVLDVQVFQPTTFRLVVTRDISPHGQRWTIEGTRSGDRIVGTVLFDEIGGSDDVRRGESSFVLDRAPV